jgi:dihydropteroate synthase
VIGGPGHGLPAGSLSCAAMINAAADTVADLQARGTVLPTGSRCLIMGVVNVTPDSFHDGGRWLDPATAIAHGVTLAGEGADMLDVGGESTRPGAAYIDTETELARVIPVIRGLARATRVPISVDTRKAAVARAALDEGAAVVNDVSAGRDDPELLKVAAGEGAGLILMHMQGTPMTMQRNPHYDDVVAEVTAFLAERVAAAEAAGVPRDAIAVDPGIGFGKRDEHNYALLGALDRIAPHHRPVLSGVSHKGFIGRALGLPADQRLEGTSAAVAWSVVHGARIVRVHDVGPMRRVVTRTEALIRGATG